MSSYFVISLQIGQDPPAEVLQLEKRHSLPIVVVEVQE